MAVPPTPTANDYEPEVQQEWGEDNSILNFPQRKLCRSPFDTWTGELSGLSSVQL